MSLSYLDEYILATCGTCKRDEITLKARRRDVIYIAETELKWNETSLAIASRNYSNAYSNRLPEQRFDAAVAKLNLHVKDA